MTSTSIHDYIVTGMSCSHCVNSVREEVSQIADVDSVDIDLASGRLTVTGRGFSTDEVRRAVQHAGYKLIAP
jgi:copper chaperone CopZ